MTEHSSVCLPLDVVPCAAAAADSELRIIATNSVFVEQWTAIGMDPGQLPGARIPLISPADERAQVKRALWRRRQGQPKPFSITLVKSRAALDLAPLDDPGASWLVTLRDIRATSKVTDSHPSIRSSLAAAVAHDMKTPLQAVLGWVSLLRKQRVTAERLDEVLSIIERNARLQAEMINDLLEATQIDGEDSLRHELVDLVEIVRQAAEALRPMAEQNGIRITSTSPGTPMAVWGDPRHLTRVVNNLMANAIRYSEPAGTVECSLSLDGGSIHLVVRDQGRGISPGFLPSVFDAFRQERRLERLPHDGIGLGLAVVRHVVQLHGGRVQAESAGPGLGATFTVTLPSVSHHSRIASLHPRNRARC